MVDGKLLLDLLKLVSDRGSHFKNLVMEEWMKYRRGMPDKGKHHFTFAYSPWANGSKIKKASVAGLAAHKSNSSARLVI